MKFWLLALLLPGVYALTDSFLNSEANGIDQFGEVMIKSIFDDGERVTVSVIPVNPEGKEAEQETLDLCPTMARVEASDENDVTPKGLLQKAFNQGRRIRVQYDGHFQRCISAVQLTAQSI